VQRARLCSFFGLCVRGSGVKKSIWTPGKGLRKYVLNTEKGEKPRKGRNVKVPILIKSKLRVTAGGGGGEEGRMFPLCESQEINVDGKKPKRVRRGELGPECKRGSPVGSLKQSCDEGGARKRRRPGTKPGGVPLRLGARGTNEGTLRGICGIRRRDDYPLERKGCRSLSSGKYCRRE